MKMTKEEKPQKVGLLKWIRSSWDTVTHGGASARKLSAFYAVVFIAGPCSIAKTNEENLIYVVAIWLIFALVTLGMVTIPELIALKNGIPLNKKDIIEPKTDPPPPDNA